MKLLPTLKLANSKASKSDSLKTSSALPASFPSRLKHARFNPTRHLTPQSLATQLDEFRNGHYSTVAQTLDIIEERDPTLKTVALKRKKAAARYGWEILTVEDPQKNPQAAAHKQTLEYLYNHLTATDATDTHLTGSTRLLVHQMMNALGVKYAVHEIVWQPRADGRLTATLRHIPLWFFEHSTEQLRFLRHPNQQTGEPLKPGEWLITTGDTLMIPSAICYMFKRLPMQDWLALCEKFALPAILGKTTAPPDSAEWRAMEHAVSRMANEFAAVMQHSDDITLLERNTSGTLPFQPLIDTCDRYLAALWRGADLSTLSKAQGIGASLQQEETTLLLEDDIALISETLQTQLSRPALEHTYGPGTEPLAYFQLKPPQKQTTQLDLQIDEFLLKHGFPLSQQDLAERYQRSLPEPEEKLLKPNNK